MNTAGGGLLPCFLPLCVCSRICVLQCATERSRRGIKLDVYYAFCSACSVHNSMLGGYALRGQSEGCEHVGQARTAVSASPLVL